ncbi:hypothetical protein Tco_0902689 [Tanacetum coccineum]
MTRSTRSLYPLAATRLHPLRQPQPATTVNIITINTLTNSLPPPPSHHNRHDCHHHSPAAATTTSTNTITTTSPSSPPSPPTANTTIFNLATSTAATSSQPKPPPQPPPPRVPSLPLKSPVYHEPSVASVVSASVVDRSIGIDNPHLSLGSQADLWCIEHLRYYFLGCLAEHPTFMGHSNLLIEVR